MNEVALNKPVLLGKVVATHGIKGAMRIASFSGHFDTILPLTSLLLKRADGGLESFEVESSFVRGKKLLVTLKEFDSIHKVQPLLGRELYVMRDQLPELAEGEYYWCDLLGLRVVTDYGEFLGTVTEIIATGSNDVYVVNNGSREYMIPALESVVLDIDLAGGEIVVSPPEGVLDL